MAMYIPLSVLHLVALVLLFTQVLADSQPGVPYLAGQEDPCSGYICLNGGRCVSKSGQAVCACPNGYTGTICQTILSVMVKEGACPPVPADASGNCLGYLCSNDAVCPGSEKCCPTACSTSVCAAPISSLDQSSSRPGSTIPSVCDGYCLNNGVCTETGGVASCACTGGFSGDRCDVTAPQPISKPGVCPNLPADLRSQCVGTACFSDSGCPETKKCCLSACFTSVCAEPVPESSSCDTMTCPSGSTCFVVRSSADTSGTATCVLDADRTCWASGYTQAHLIPASGDQAAQLQTISCGRSRWFSPSCPQGTRCSQPSSVFPGICCVGQLSEGPYQNSYWSRRLRIYRREAGDDPCGGCPANQSCVEVRDAQSGSQYQCIDQADSQS